MRSTGRMPNRASTSCSSSTVSARWVCNRRPSRRASAADSRISCGVTLNGEHGRDGHDDARAVVQPLGDRLGAGQDRVEILDDAVRRQPAGRGSEVHRPAGEVQPYPDGPRGRREVVEDRVVTSGYEVVVVCDGGAPAQRQLGQPDRRSGEDVLGLQPGPHRVERGQPARTGCSRPHAPAWPTGRGGDGC